MNSEDASTIALAPFVRVFTYAIIKSLRVKNPTGQKHILHADLVPKFSEKIIRASLGEKTSKKLSPSFSGMDASIISGGDQPKVHKFEKSDKATQAFSLGNLDSSQIQPSIMEPPKKDLRQLGPAPQAAPSTLPQQLTPSALPQQPTPSMLPTQTVPPQHQSLSTQVPGRFGPPKRSAPPTQRMAFPVRHIAPPTAPEGEGMELTQFYGKITPLLNDPSVSVVECPGMGKRVMIVRRGQKQGTKIVLSAKEIKHILEKVSEAAHIPLLEGVFRAAVDTFSINAIVSGMIGSRFVIKKQSIGGPQ